MDLRASVIEFVSSPGGETSRELKRCTGVDSISQLEKYLDEASESTTSSSDRRLYIVETPINKTTFPKLESILASKLGMSRDIFKRHQWSQTTFRFNEVINCPRLPTTSRPRRCFSLEYFELWQVEETNHKAFDRHNPITVQSVILCDPPPRTVWLKNTLIDLNITAFEGGYHEFIPDDILDLKSENPLHDSFMDDLCYYYQNHVDVLGRLSDPASAMIFPRKLVASHYCQLLGFVSHQTASMRSSGWAAQRRTQEEIDESNQVETAWSQFKCPEYLEALGAVLDSLGIPQGHEPYDTPEVSPAIESAPTNRAREPQVGNGDWLSSTADFLYLHREFRAHLADYARMTSSLAALNGMIGGRIAILEARTAKSLTIVAMVFAPPACVASIFSIPDAFGLDGPRFWVYWVATIPLTIIVFLLTYLIHERDEFIRLWQTRDDVAGPQKTDGNTAEQEHRLKDSASLA